MAILMIMHWPGATAEQYDKLRPIVNWETDHPRGAQYHVSSFDNEGAHVVDVWDSQEEFQAFFETRLGPGVQQVGMPGQPDVKFYPVHATFAPNARTIA